MTQDAPCLGTIDQRWARASGLGGEISWLSGKFHTRTHIPARLRRPPLSSRTVSNTAPKHYIGVEPITMAVPSPTSPASSPSHVQCSNATSKRGLPTVGCVCRRSASNSRSVFSSGEEAAQGRQSATLQAALTPASRTAPMRLIPVEGRAPLEQQRQQGRGRPHFASRLRRTLPLPEQPGSTVSASGATRYRPHAGRFASGPLLTYQGMRSYVLGASPPKLTSEADQTRSGESAPPHVAPWCIHSSAISPSFTCRSEQEDSQELQI